MFIHLKIYIFFSISLCFFLTINHTLFNLDTNTDKIQKLNFHKTNQNSINAFDTHIDKNTLNSDFFNGFHNDFTDTVKTTLHNLLSKLKYIHEKDFKIFMINDKTIIHHKKLKLQECHLKLEVYLKNENDLNKIINELKNDKKIHVIIEELMLKKKYKSMIQHNEHKTHKKIIYFELTLNLNIMGIQKL